MAKGRGRANSSESSEEREARRPLPSAPFHPAHRLRPTGPCVRRCCRCRASYFSFILVSRLCLIKRPGRGQDPRSASVRVCACACACARVCVLTRVEPGDGTAGRWSDFRGVVVRRGPCRQLAVTEDCSGVGCGWVRCPLASSFPPLRVLSSRWPIIILACIARVCGTYSQRVGCGDGNGRGESERK